jgi:hypothetical protein
MGIAPTQTPLKRRSVRTSTTRRWLNSNGHDQENERRYSPAQCIGAVPPVIMGRPDPEHISTSYVETVELERSHVDAALHAAIERF